MFPLKTRYILPNTPTPSIIISNIEFGPILYVMFCQMTNLPPGRIFISIITTPSPTPSPTITPPPTNTHPPTPSPTPTSAPLTKHWWFWLSIIGGGTVVLLSVIVVISVCYLLFCTQIPHYERIQ